MAKRGLFRKIKRIFVKPKPAKFGVSFVVYDGEELLEKAIKHIRPAADYINIVFSEKSYYGDSGNPGVKALCESLLARGLVDEIAQFENKPISKDHPECRIIRRGIQIKKRNKGLDMALCAGCTYFMTMDTDEFYDAAALITARQEILRNPKWTHTFVHILNYGRDPTKRYDGRKWEYYVPFFAKINGKSKLGINQNAPVKVDPTRCVNHTKSSKYYVLSDIFMHHFTRVRKKLDDKYVSRNTTNAVDADWINREENFITVPDYFGLKDIIK